MQPALQVLLSVKPTSGWLSMHTFSGADRSIDKLIIMDRPRILTFLLDRTGIVEGPEHSLVQNSRKHHSSCCSRRLQRGAMQAVNSST